MIELRKVTWANMDDVVALKVKKEQDEFVAPNDFSLAEAYLLVTEFNKLPLTLAIYAYDTLIGFIMVFTELAANNPSCKYYGDKKYYKIWRFMIDEKYQGKGYGKQAMVKLVELIRTRSPLGQADAIYLSYEPTNEAARKLYTSVGFLETGYFNPWQVARLGLK